MTDFSTVESQPFSTRTLHLAFLLICGCLLLLLGLADVGLTDRDEGSNAGAAREMLETGDWISPTLNYEPRYAKPAGTYWITAGIYALFGVNDFTARLQSAAFGLALLVLQYLFLHRLLGPALAFCGSLVLLLNVEFVGIHRMVLTDPALVFFTTLATYGFWLGFCDSNRNPRFLWTILSWHGAGHVGQRAGGRHHSLVGHRAIPDAHPAMDTLFRGRQAAARLDPLRTHCRALVSGAMLSIHGADYVAAAQANTTGRFANPMEGHGGTLLFYVPVLLLGFFPWSGLLPAALWQSIKEWKSFRTGTTDPRGEEGLLLFCALWVSGIFLFFTLSATRLPHYVLPLYPPAALLVAVLWSRFLKNAWPTGLLVSRRIILVTGYLFSIALGSVPLIYANVRDQIAVHFPAAAKIGVGVTPIVLGVLVFLGVAISRHLVREEARRPQAFWVLSGMMGLFLLVVILFALPRFGKYFVNPPQELATIAGFNLGPQDTLIHYGRKLPSLTFYAKHKVQFINPDDHEKFFPHLKKDGRIMVILPANLRERLPHPVDSFTPILQRFGFLLLSREPMVEGAPKS